MTSITQEKVLKIPLKIAYEFIIKWVDYHDLKIKQCDPINSIIVKFKAWVGPNKTNKLSFNLRQIDQFSIQISTKVSMSGAYAFKGLLHRVFRESILFHLLSELDSFEKNLEAVSNMKTLTEKEHFFYKDPQVVLNPQKEGVENTQTSNIEYEKLIKRKKMYEKILKEVGETDLTFASKEKKEEVQGIINLYSHRIREIDKKLSEFE